MINKKSYCIVDVTKAEAKEDAERRAAIKEYEDHKKGFAKNIQFDGRRANKSRLFNILCNTQNCLLQKVKFLTRASTFGSWWAALPMTGPIRVVWVFSLGSFSGLRKI